MIDRNNRTEKCFGVKISSDMFTFYLYTGVIGKPGGWDYKECALQAKVWNKRSNAEKWCDIGNKYYKDNDHDVRLEVCPVVVECD